MNNLKYKPVEDTLEVSDSNDIRYVKTEYGIDREVRSSMICCVCDERLWVIENIGRQTILAEAFKVIDNRAYIYGVPDYIKTKNSLLSCHYSCQVDFNNQLNDGTFVQH